MEERFWQDRWRENRIGFHEDQPNDLLLKHFAQLNTKHGDRVFVPLCGKTFDIDWLLTKGVNVVGIEFSQRAVEEVFNRLNITPSISRVGALKCYNSDRLTLYVGDFFALNQSLLGNVSAIYDRAALIALPPASRVQYTKHLTDITACARQLLITLNYDQTKMDGPPFAVPETEIRAHYQADYSIDHLFGHPLSGPISKRSEGSQNVWLLT